MGMPGLNLPQKEIGLNCLPDPNGSFTNKIISPRKGCRWYMAVGLYTTRGELARKKSYLRFRGEVQVDG